MFEIGEKILVFRKIDDDYYHNRGIYAEGIIIKNILSFI